MTELALNARSWVAQTFAHIWSQERVWLFSAILLLVLMVFNSPQGVASTAFVVKNLINVAPFLLLSIGIAAYAGATGADGLIARAFTGSAAVMILIAAIAGGLSPSALAA